MKVLTVLAVSLVFSFTAFAAPKCINKIEKLDKRTKLYKSLKKVVAEEKVVKSKKKKLTGNLANLFINQKCVDKKKKVKAVRVVYHAEAQVIPTYEPEAVYCYSKFVEYPETYEWDHTQTICESANSSSSSSSSPVYHPEFEAMGYPFGNPEDPFYDQGRFVGSPSETFTSDFPGDVIYQDWGPEYYGAATTGYPVDIPSSSSSSSSESSSSSSSDFYPELGGNPGMEGVDLDFPPQ